MASWLSRLIGKAPAPTPLWKTVVDTRLQRYEALDMALLNVHICTRFEREKEQAGGDTLVGDYLEFGVFEGSTFLHACHRASGIMPFMRFFAFDSFQGLPKPEGSDATGEFAEGQFCCTEPRFHEILGESGVDRTRVRVVPGWFDQSLTGDLKKKHDLRVASVAYIDCDLFKSTAPVMRFLTDLVRQGTILMFDDWYCFRARPTHGVRGAVGEWLKENPHISLEPWHPFSHHGQSFIVQVSENDNDNDEETGGAREPGAAPV